MRSNYQIIKELQDQNIKGSKDQWIEGSNYQTKKNERR